MAENAPQPGPAGQRGRTPRSARIAAVPDSAAGSAEAATEEIPAGTRSWTETESVLQRLGLLDAQGHAVPPGADGPGGRPDDATMYGAPVTHPSAPPSRRRGGAWPPGPLAIVLASLGLVVAALAVPALILSWRAALAPVPSVGGVVAGVLSAVGVLLLATGAGWLAADAAAVRGDAESGRWLAVLGRSSVLIAASGVLTLAAAAAAAS